MLRRNGYNDEISDFEKAMIPNISNMFLNPLIMGT
jgi:hypothetical protein